MNEPLAVLKQGPIWRVVLSVPERRNALSRALVSALAKVVEDAELAPELRVVVLSGAGAAFCAGADLVERRQMTPPEVVDFLDQLNRTLTALARSSKVWIAAISGACLGGGLELALCTDLRIAGPDARLGLPEVRLGIIPGAGGTQRLSRLVGVATAKRLILTGLPIGGDEALRVGLVSEVAPQPVSAALALAEQVAETAPLALALAKRAVDEGFDRPLTEGLSLERACYDEALGSEDRLEGLQAFAESRRPVFKGR